jgi:tetratricopeptide (TPR) repeat protein
MFRSSSMAGLGCALLLALGMSVFSSHLLWGRQQELTADQQAAKAKLDEGVKAYRNGQFDEAIADFKQAAELDPSSTKAHLYLATAYASEYIPGAPSDENLNLGKKAIQEFQTVLDHDPKNLTAMDGIGSILYNMGANPFDASKLRDSKKLHLEHIEIRPSDPEPYYWIGVIDWSIAYHAEQQKRADLKSQTGQELSEEQPLPYPQRDELRTETQEAVDEGIKYLKKAVELRRDYDDALSYLSLTYRRKAAIEPEGYERSEDIKAADELIDQIQKIREARMEEQPQQ